MYLLAELGQLKGSDHLGPMMVNEIPVWPDFGHGKILKHVEKGGDGRLLGLTVLPENKGTILQRPEKNPNVLAGKGIAVPELVCHAV